MKKVKGVAMYGVVRQEDDFETSAKMIWELIVESQKKFPNEDRHLFLDILGHRTANGAFDHDMFELQKDFIIGFVLPHLKSVSMPLGKVENLKKQDNDIPMEELIIQVASVI